MMKYWSVIILGLYLLAAGASFLGMAGEHDIYTRRCLAEIASTVDCTDPASASSEALFHVQAFQRLSLGVFGFDGLTGFVISFLGAALVVASVLLKPEPTVLRPIVQTRWRSIASYIRQVFFKWFAHVKLIDPLPNA